MLLYPPALQIPFQQRQNPLKLKQFLNKNLSLTRDSNRCSGDQESLLRPCSIRADSQLVNIIGQSQDGLIKPRDSFNNASNSRTQLITRNVLSRSCFTLPLDLVQLNDQTRIPLSTKPLETME